MKIIFIRNGESSHRTNKLTLRGHLQVLDTKKFLKDENFDIIYSSPQIRALQTAKILNKRHNKPLVIQTGLDDRKPLSFDKQNFSEDYHENFFNYNYENENFQTCKKYLEQVFKTMEKITSENKGDKTVLIVAHNATLIGINAFIHGISESGQIAWTQTKGGAVIKFLI